MVLTCAICSSPISKTLAKYPNAVCKACDKMSVNLKGESPWTNSNFDEGENPIFVDGIKCWRRYRFGGWITMRDLDNHSTIQDFIQDVLKSGWSSRSDNGDGEQR